MFTSSIVVLLCGIVDKVMDYVYHAGCPSMQTTEIQGGQLTYYG
jgi:hypothetical protein